MRGAIDGTVRWILWEARLTNHVVHIVRLVDVVDNGAAAVGRHAAIGTDSGT